MSSFRSRWLAPDETPPGNEGAISAKWPESATSGTFGTLYPGHFLAPDKELERYAALCAAQKRLASDYVPGSLACLDSITLAELETNDRTLESAYFAANDAVYSEALQAWEAKRRERITFRNRDDLESKNRNK